MSDETLMDLYDLTLKAYKEAKAENMKRVLSKLIDLLSIEIDSRLEITI